MYPVMIDLNILKMKYVRHEFSEEARLDILICNAGLITQDRIVTEDGYEHMFAVNHLGIVLWILCMVKC